MIREAGGVARVSAACAAGVGDVMVSSCVLLLFFLMLMGAISLWTGLELRILDGKSR
jgi:hypothetical protein